MDDIQIVDTGTETKPPEKNSSGTLSKAKESAERDYTNPSTFNRIATLPRVALVSTVAFLTVTVSLALLFW